MSLAIWVEGEKHEVSSWLHQDSAQSALAAVRGIVGMADARPLRRVALPNDSRHPMGQTAFQDGRPLAGSIREGGRVRLRLQENPS